MVNIFSTYAHYLRFCVPKTPTWLFLFSSLGYHFSSLVPRPSRLGQSWTLPGAVTSPRDTRREIRNLARSFPDFARTTGQEGTPRD